MGVLGMLFAARGAVADERGVVGRKLVIIDKLEAAGKAKIVFVAKDPAPGAIHKGPAADPPGLTGSVSVFPLSDVTGNRGEFTLDDGATGTWIVNKETVAKYVNKDAAVGALGVKVAVVKPDKLLKVVAKNLGDGDAASGDDNQSDLHPGAITAGDIVRVVVAITKHEGNGVFTTHRMCADFADLITKSIAGGTGTKIVSTTSFAPADCDDVTVTTTTMPGGTTTTTLPLARLAFVTSASFTGGAVGGLTGADAKCNAAAAAEGLPGTYLAWLSECGSNQSPSTRFADGAPWIRVDGAPLADNLADLLDGTLDNPLSADETGAEVPSGTLVWTGTEADGTPLPPTLCSLNTCVDWLASNVAATGLTGVAPTSGATWTQSSTLSCSNALRLYCFQQDGSGGTTTTVTSSTTTTTIAGACDIFAQNCPSGFGCYPTGGVPSTQCLPQGSGGLGASCGQPNTCQAGLICIVVGAQSTCRLICEVGGPPCPGGAFCTELIGSNIPDLGACL